LHLTIGVNVVTWLDAFRAALDELRDDLDFRRSWQTGDGTDDLVEALRARLGREEVERRAREKLVRSRRPIREGQLRQLRALDELDMDTELERNPTVLADVVERNGSIALVFEGRELTFPAHAQEEVVTAAEAEDPFTASDLPGSLDEAGRLVLVRRLVREGLLRISEA
jgi:bifunctional lysine-specific demethylase and histidyl-hydroxylase MINA